MSGKLLIDSAFQNETRVAVVDEKNILQNIDREMSSIKQLKGNIYLAKIIRVEPSLQAAFINYGGDRHGFLPFADIHPDYYNIAEDKKNDLTQVKFFIEEDKADDTNIQQNITTTDTGNSILTADTFDASSEDFEIADYVDTEDSVLTNSTVETTTEKKTAEQGHYVFSSNSEENDYNRFNYEDDELKTDNNKSNSGEYEYRKYKIEDVLKEGQYLLVQVLKEERGNKGVALTTYISLAGKYSVLMANVKGKGGISKKVTNMRDRKILRNILNTINPNDEKSIIIRTAGIGKKPEDILRDYVYLTRLWRAIKQVSLESQAPSFIHSEDDILKRAVRDLCSDNIEEIVVEGADAYKNIKNLVSRIAPDQKTIIKEYTDKVPLFFKYNIEEQMLNLYNNKIPLPSGGSIVIDQTEALVAIDVNSGKATKTTSIEEMAVANNVEAAKEIARQVKLRDLGGLIVIDFIDMFEYKSRRIVEKALQDAFVNDRAKLQFDKISMLGLLEMSRQRINASFSEKISEKCSCCDGKGMVKSRYIVADSILRSIKCIASNNTKTREIYDIFCSKPVAEYLLNYKKNEINSIEMEYSINIIISSDNDRSNDDFDIKKHELLTTVEKIDLMLVSNTKGKVNESFEDEELYEEKDEELNSIIFGEDCYYNNNENKQQKNYYDNKRNNSTTTERKSNNYNGGNKKSMSYYTIKHKQDNSKNKKGFFGKIIGLFKKQ